MGMRILREIAQRLILIGSGLLPGASLAQMGWFATPSLSAAHVYDDNLFSTPSQRERERILRLSPAIEAGYRSDPLDVRGRYTSDAERYARHPELDTNQAREQAGVDFRYQPTHKLTLAADASYIKTQTPGELNLDTGLEHERIRAERLSFSPTVAYRFDRLTVGTTTYAYTRDELEGGMRTDTHAMALSIDRRFTRQDVMNVGYTLQEFRFDGQDRVTSQALTVGDTHQFTPRTAVALSGGPRFSDGSIDPELSASLRQRLERGELALTYTRGATTAIGQAGVATTEALGASAAVRFGSSLEIRVAPSFLSSTRGSLQADVVRADIEAGYRLTDTLSLFGSYQFSRQRGSLDTRSDADVRRNIILFGIVIAPPRARGDSVLLTRPRIPSALGEESDLRPTNSYPQEEK